MGRLLLNLGLNSVRGVCGASDGFEMGDRASDGIILVRGGLRLVEARATEARVGVRSELRTVVRGRGRGRACAGFEGVSAVVGRRVDASSELLCLTRLAPAAGAWAGEGLRADLLGEP